MSQLKLFLFGSPRLQQDGVLVEFDTRKAIALLAYLAINQPTAIYGRDSLATLLWPNYDQNRARANLRRTLSVLTKSVGHHLIEADRETISLVKNDALWVDILQFRQLLAAGNSHNHPSGQICSACLPLLTEAQALYQADFMSGFNLPDSPDFEEWQFFQAENLRREITNVLQKLVQGHIALAQYELALANARRWVSFDPLDEPAQRYLIQLYAWTGQRNAARRQYQKLADLLDEELGIAPDEETQTLFEKLQENRLAPPPVEADNIGAKIPETDNRSHLAVAGHPAAPVHNLPAQTTPFIGRDTERSELTRLLATPSCRLLSLVGPGGVGKTRLAIEVASAAFEHFNDGVCFVSLAPVNNAEHIVSAIAEALSLSLVSSGNATTQLCNYLKEKHLLLLIDNLEHLIVNAQPQIPGPVAPAQADITLLADILHQAPAVKMLVTSRERLHLQGEWVFEIHGLPVPSPQLTIGFDQYSAIRLFTQSARRVKTDFKLSPADQPFIARICQLVDGMPLGIELAAAWVHLLSPAEIAAEIERTLDFLTTSAPDVPARHRSLRAAFDHSWNLLSTEEQQALSRLSVFRGGFSREAAAQIARASLPILSTLVDKSLLRRTAAGRYDLHELVRQFAASYLQQYPQEPAHTLEQHCAYFSARLQQAQPLMRSEQQTSILEQLAPDIDNFRLAWNWAITRQKIFEIGQSAEGLAIFYDLQGLSQEAETSFEQAAAALKQTTNPSNPAYNIAQGRVLAMLGWFAMRRGKLSRAKELLHSGLALLRLTEAKASQAEALIILGLTFRRTGEYHEAAGYLNEGLAIGRAANFLWGEAVGLYGLGAIAFGQGDLPKAAALFDESLALCRQMGEPRMTTLCLNAASAIPYTLGRYDEAEKMLNESLALNKFSADLFSLGTVIYHLGLVYYGRGHYDTALAYVNESLTLFKEIDDYANTIRALNSLGKISFAQQNYPQAWQYYRQALTMDNQSQHTPNILDVLAGVADLLTLDQQPDTALEVVTHILGHSASSSDAQHRASRTKEQLVTLLPPAQVDVLQNAALSKSLDDIVSQVVNYQPAAAAQNPPIQ